VRASSFASIEIVAVRAAIRSQFRPRLRVASPDCSREGSAAASISVGSAGKSRRIGGSTGRHRMPGAISAQILHLLVVAVAV
jgi:hypothetical protein